MRSGGGYVIENGEPKLVEPPTREQLGGPREADGSPVGPTETEKAERERALTPDRAAEPAAHDPPSPSPFDKLRGDGEGDATQNSQPRRRGVR